MEMWHRSSEWIYEVADSLGSLQIRLAGGWAYLHRRVSDGGDTCDIACEAFSDLVDQMWPGGASDACGINTCSCCRWFAIGRSQCLGSPKWFGNKNGKSKGRLGKFFRVSIRGNQERRSESDCWTEIEKAVGVFIGHVEDGFVADGSRDLLSRDLSGGKEALHGTYGGHPNRSGLEGHCLALADYHSEVDTSLVGQSMDLGQYLGFPSLVPSQTIDGNNMDRTRAPFGLIRLGVSGTPGEVGPPVRQNTWTALESRFCRWCAHSDWCNKGLVVAAGPRSRWRSIEPAIFRFFGCFGLER
ncbi:hypothetical protein NE237_011828 [Protea cynaroides]|uniref:Uncharacterized protein n=1 Tax=Protea cynaroides TaxID=273540 RepID=A0A9Q0GYZ3_9MAGN|nr:hypothetical protein NE237_011828 [Protea cynaroides]